VRQKGTPYRAGRNTYHGKDFTIHAKVTGVVSFSEKRLTKFNGRRDKCTLVHVNG
jgi:ribosomal protein L27